MDTSSFAPIYVIGLALNLIALGYAITAGEWLLASAFAFVLVYLLFRYRMIRNV